MSELNDHRNYVDDLLALEERARRNRDKAEAEYQAVRIARRRAEGRRGTAYDRAKRIWGMTGVAVLVAGIAKWAEQHTAAAALALTGTAAAGGAAVAPFVLPGSGGDPGPVPTVTRAVPELPVPGPIRTLTATPNPTSERSSSEPTPTGAPSPSGAPTPQPTVSTKTGPGNGIVERPTIEAPLNGEPRAGIRPPIDPPRGSPPKVAACAVDLPSAAARLRLLCD